MNIAVIITDIITKLDLLQLAFYQRALFFSKYLKYFVVIVNVFRKWLFTDLLYYFVVLYYFVIIF